ncbi:hypothetical protein L6472_08520 [Prevotella sp. E13-17]|uniref:transposase n=1 Tax=Prevotella sp. E13-17 TaxID=2913616 RepID=UPI001EDA6F8E|nr:transposase [Prevotella sp. E13-17]UKK50083.1 hypothetical protein L6472_08520 [Prevotella sp. E13-17]
MSRSREEAIALGVPVSETQHNMKRRKPWHDYSRKGTYMLTLVVEGRQSVFGKVVTAPVAKSAGGKQTVRAYVELSELGKEIRDKELQKISKYYGMVEVWKLCVMPDHIHMIVRVKEDMPGGKHLGNVVRGFKVGCTRAWWRLSETLPAGEAAGVVAGGDVAGVVPAGKAAGVVAGGEAAGVVAGGEAKLPVLFESGYNDLILLEDGQLDNWARYLDDNPRRLAVKRMFPDFFTTMNYVDIGEWHCQTVGNRFLLDIPLKVAVIVHNAYSDKEFADYKREWLACGEAGGVLVSAAIATREKEVMREAMNRGYKIIVVRENGFPPLYKPAGESFDACSEGRLLQVCPWEYHMERRIISREKCLKLNRLVEDILSKEQTAEDDNPRKKSS